MSHVHCKVRALRIYSYLLVESRPWQSQPPYLLNWSAPLIPGSITSPKRTLAIRLKRWNSASTTLLCASMLFSKKQKSNNPFRNASQRVMNCVSKLTCLFKSSRFKKLINPCWRFFCVRSYALMAAFWDYSKYIYLASTQTRII
jgi:hypothetical protein